MQTLKTKRLVLRAFKKTDLQDFYDYAQVEGVGERAGWRHHASMDESKDILDDFIKKDDVYAIVLKKNCKVIGSLGVHPPDDAKDSIDCREIGYVLNRDYWGQGLMSEAVSAVIAHCFDHLGYEKLVCGHFLDNAVSRRIIEKHGFRFVGEKTFHSQSLDKSFRSLRYELTKADYLLSHKDERSDGNRTAERQPKDRRTLYPIILTAYDPNWLKYYDEMVSCLTLALGKRIFRIHHIGSTAVAGLKAKPTIDILLEIHEDSAVDAVLTSLSALGLNHRHEPENPPPHALFTKGYNADGYGERVYHIHVRYPGDWDELYFRDALRESETLRVAYTQLKERLAASYARERLRYTDGKSDFIQTVVRQARKRRGVCYAPVKDNQAS